MGKKSRRCRHKKPAGMRRFAVGWERKLMASFRATNTARANKRRGR